MSPSEQDRKIAKELRDVMERFFHGPQTSEHMYAALESLERKSTQALADAREQAVKPFIESGLALPDGTPRKVRGTLPMTADGVIVFSGEVFHPDQDWSFQLHVMPMTEWAAEQLEGDADAGEWQASYSYYESETGFSASEVHRLHDCYSTREAALASRETRE